MSDWGAQPSPPEFGWEPPTGPPLKGPPVDQITMPPPGRVRPWWGMGDALLLIPVMAIVFAISFAAIAVLAVIEGVEFADIGSTDSSAVPASLLVIPTLIQQAAWFGWPFVVSKWKGLGPASDWGWAFKPVDLGIGLGTAMIAMFSAGVAGAITSAIVGLEDESLAENTQIITDVEDSPWLYGVLFVVVIGAPFSEELLFRGLILRAVEKRLGTVAGIIGSLLFFVPIHFADEGVFTAGQVVLWVSIATLGAVLAIAAVMTRRLAAPIIAHMFINGVASAGALGAFDGLTDGLAT